MSSFVSSFVCLRSFMSSSFVRLFVVRSCRLRSCLRLSSFVHVVVVRSFVCSCRSFVRSCLRRNVRSSVFRGLFVPHVRSVGRLSGVRRVVVHSCRSSVVRSFVHSCRSFVCRLFVRVSFVPSFVRLFVPFARRLLAFYFIVFLEGWHALGYVVVVVSWYGVVCRSFVRVDPHRSRPVVFCRLCLSFVSVVRVCRLCLSFVSFVRLFVRRLSAFFCVFWQALLVLVRTGIKIKIDVCICMYVCVSVWRTLSYGDEAVCDTCYHGTDHYVISRAGVAGQ